METIPANNTCTIRFVVAPNTASRVDIKFDPQLNSDKYKNKTIIVFILRHISELAQLVERFLQQFNTKYDHVSFDYKGTPDRIKKDITIKTTILNVLKPQWRNISVSTLIATYEDEIKRHAKFLKNHIALYGNAPDMTDLSDRGMKKKINYARSVLAQPNMCDKTILQIIQLEDTVTP